jgi:hypothetical protein
VSDAETSYAQPRHHGLPLEDVAARLHDLLQADGGPDGTLEEARALSVDLFQALPNRFVIERAKGVVMGCLGCDVEDAFRELREQSQRTNRPLRDGADEVATTGRLPWLD